jgi:hypothetical protein
MGRPSSKRTITSAIASLVAEGKLPNSLLRKQNIDLVRMRVHALFPGKFASDNGLARETIANYLALQFSMRRRSRKPTDFAIVTLPQPLS